MTFQEAEKEVAELARGGYHFIHIGITFFAGGERRSNCFVFWDNEGATASTFRAAIDLVKAQIAAKTGVEQMPEVSDGALQE